MDGTLTKSTTQTLTLEDRRMNIHSTDQGYDENVDAANIYLDTLCVNDRTTLQSNGGYTRSRNNWGNLFGRNYTVI